MPMSSAANIARASRFVAAVFGELGLIALSERIRTWIFSCTDDFASCAVQHGPLSLSIYSLCLFSPICTSVVLFCPPLSIDSSFCFFSLALFLCLSPQDLILASTTLHRCSFCSSFIDQERCSVSKRQPNHFESVWIWPAKTLQRFTIWSQQHSNQFQFCSSLYCRFFFVVGTIKKSVVPISVCYFHFGFLPTCSYVVYIVVLCIEFDSFTCGIYLIRKVCNM